MKIIIDLEMENVRSRSRGVALTVVGAAVGAAAVWHAIADVRKENDNLLPKCLKLPKGCGVLQSTILRLQDEKQTLMDRIENLEKANLLLNREKADLVVRQLGVAMVQRCAIAVLGAPPKGDPYYKRIKTFDDIRKLAEKQDKANGNTDAVDALNALSSTVTLSTINAVASISRDCLAAAHPACIHPIKQCIQINPTDPRRCCQGMQSNRERILLHLVSKIGYRIRSSRLVFRSFGRQTLSSNSPLFNLTPQCCEVQLFGRCDDR